MGEKRIYLANGDELIQSDEGVYFILMDGTSLPILIDREEGEYLLFETVKQLKSVLETTIEEKEQLEADVNSLENQIVHKHLPRIEELELFINDYLELHRKQKKLSEQAENLL